MAKFTLSFKGMPINVFHFESGSIHIGRDESNEIRIESLAVAPAHAAVVFRPGGATIRQLNDHFPLIVNNHEVRTHNLANGDQILVGKHLITYTSQETIPQDVAREENGTFQSLEQKTGGASGLPEANLQVINGKHIGRVMSLKQALTRLGRPGQAVAVIARRRQGYFLSALEGGDKIRVGRKPVGEDSVRLKNGDVVDIDGMAIEFYEQEP